MKKLLLSLLLSANVFAQGDPAPYVKGQNQSGLGNVSSTIVVPNQQSTKINSYQSRLETGNTNVLLDPNFEGATTAWSAYADAAGTSPVDCTGGSPTVSVSNSTTTPLEGNKSLLAVKTAVNSQGNGYSVPFTINASGQGMVQRINFDYRVLSGTYANGDVTFWIYDVTNGVLIQPSANSLLNSSITEPKEQLEFQASINSRSYRLCAHVSTTSASAYSLQFDNFSLGRTSKSYGSPALGAISVSMTSNFTNSNITAWMTRVGDRAFFEGIVNLTGTPATADLIVSLPSGYVIDTNKVAFNNIRTKYGSGWVYDTSAGLTFDALVRAETTTSVRMYRYVTTTNGQTAPLDQVTPITFATGDSVYFKFDVPIVGWSSQTSMSDSADTRVVAARYYASTTSVGTSYTTVVHPNRTFDTHGAYNSLTGEYRVPVAGLYKVATFLQGPGIAFTVNRIADATIYKNGADALSPVAIYSATGSYTARPMLQGHGYVEANAGDILTLRMKFPVATAIDISTNWVSFERVSGPSQIAASETVGALYKGNPPTGTLNAGYNTVTFPTKIKDSHNAYSSGSYGVQTPGLYSICAQVSISGTFAANNPSYIAIFVDGVQVTDNVIYAYGSGLTAAMPQTCIHSYPLLPSQAVTIRAATAASSPSFQADPNRNYFSIIRTGNY